MYQRLLLPESLRPPDTFGGPGFAARPLRLADAEADFEAVMATASRLQGVLDPDSDWPAGLTLHENRVDLGWHEREFTLGHSYAWTLRDPGDRQVLGCAYLYPAERADFSAMGFWWVRTGFEHLDGLAGRVFRELIAELPVRCAFPGRDISWPAWKALEASRE